MTQPDLNVSVKDILRDFTRDRRSLEFENDLEIFDEDLVDGLTSPSVDPLTDSDMYSEELETMQKSSKK